MVDFSPRAPPFLDGEARREKADLASLPEQAACIFDKFDSIGKIEIDVRMLAWGFFRGQGKFH
ncbi:hypothetical protein [Burkholderia sp. 3C]